MADTATSEALTPLRNDEPDWLAEAQHIADIYEQPTPRNSHAFIDVYRVNRMLRLIADGNYRGVSALAAGFSRQHLANWDRDAKGGLIAAIALFDAIEKAEAFAEADAVSDVRKAGKAGPQFWAASATRLERRHPERWGKRGEDCSGPKVIVQLGAGSLDVRVGVLVSSSEPLSPVLPPALGEGPQNR